MDMVDLREKINISIDLNEVIRSFVSLIKIKADEDLYKTLEPDDIASISDTLICQFLSDIVHQWNNNQNFRSVLCGSLIGSSVLDKLSNKSHEELIEMLKKSLN